MAGYIGGTPVSKLWLGATPIQKAWIGGTLFFTSGAIANLTVQVSGFTARARFDVTGSYESAEVQYSADNATWSTGEILDTAPGGVGYLSTYRTFTPGGAAYFRVRGFSQNAGAGTPGDWVLASSTISQNQAPSVTISPASLTLQVGQSATVTATATDPEEGSLPKTFRSTDTAIATVTSGGVVTVHAVGSCSIIARTVDSFGASDEATCALTAIMAAPGAFTLSLSMSGVTGSLSWTASAGATSYDVHRGGVLIASGVTARTFTDGNLARDSEFFWHVVARNSTGTTSSNTVSGVTVPNAPSLPLISNITSTGATISRDVNEQPAHFIGWRIRLASTGFEGPMLSPLETEYPWGGLTQSTYYEFDMEYYNAAGGSGYGPNEHFTTLSNIPQAPAYVTVTTRSWLEWGAQRGEVKIQWPDAVSDSSWNYVLERSLGGEFYDLVETGPCTGGMRTKTIDVGTETGVFAYRVYFTRSGYADSAATSGSGTLSPRSNAGAPGISISDDSVCFNGSPFYKKTITCGATPAGWTLKMQETDSGYSSVIETLIDSTTITSNTDNTVAGPGGFNYYRAYRYRSNSEAPTGVDTTAISTGARVTTSATLCLPQLGSVTATANGLTASCTAVAGNYCESILYKIYRNGSEVVYNKVNTSPNGGAYSLQSYTGSNGDVISYDAQACGGKDGAGPYGAQGGDSVTLSNTEG